MNFINKCRVGLLAAALGGTWGGMSGAVPGQEETAPGALPMPAPVEPGPAGPNPNLQERSFLPAAAAAPAEAGKPLPINLPTALKLGDARAIDVQVASEKIRLAAAQLQQARVLWVPTFLMGTEYFRHDGQIQNVTGDVVNNSHASMTLGASPILIVTATDALFAPLAQRQILRSQQAFQQAAQNDTVLAIAEAYFQVQQARGELAAVQDVRGKMEDLVRRIAQLADVLAPVERCGEPGLPFCHGHPALPPVRPAPAVLESKPRLSPTPCRSGPLAGTPVAIEESGAAPTERTARRWP